MGLLPQRQNTKQQVPSIKRQVANPRPLNTISSLPGSGLSLELSNFIIYNVYIAYNIYNSLLSETSENMPTQMVVRIDPETKKRFGKLARMEGKTSSQMVRELIEAYLKERDIGSYIDNLWDRLGSRLADQGVTVNDVEKAVKEARKKDGNARRH